MKLLATLPIFCLLALASALDSPQRCTSPDQMEGILSIFAPVQFSTDHGMFSYDATNKRLYSNLFISSSKETWQQVDILLFEESVMYEYLPQNKTCLRGKIQTPFQKIGVPDNATVLGPSTIGTLQVPDAGLLCNNWNWFHDGAYCIMSFTDYECFPVYQVNVLGTSWYSVSFYNLALGIQQLIPWAWPSLSLG